MVSVANKRRRTTRSRKGANKVVSATLSWDDLDLDRLCAEIAKNIDNTVLEILLKERNARKS